MSCVLATSVSVNNTPHRVWVGTLCIVWLWCGIYVLCWYWWTFCGWRSTWYESTSTRHTIIMNNTFHSQSTATLRNIVSVGSRYFLVAVEPISCTHTHAQSHTHDSSTYYLFKCSTDGAPTFDTRTHSHTSDIDFPIGDCRFCNAVRFRWVWSLPMLWYVVHISCICAMLRYDGESINYYECCRVGKLTTNVKLHSHGRFIIVDQNDRC